jgi:hypothetical protein
MMTHCAYSFLLFFTFFIINQAKNPDDPLQGMLKKEVVGISSICFFYSGTNSVCADVCTSPEAHVELDLSQPRINRENKHVQIHLHHTGSGRCREPGTRKKDFINVLNKQEKCSFISFHS